jgi:cellulose synthase/poly-beta-1,6-N-acetylglucosamine synthase-like glycosyltransferase
LTDILAALLWAGLACGLATSTYLAGLALISLGGSRRHQTRASGRTRFALIVPAHNEEAMLAQTLRSIAAQTYPKELFSTHVVADNCSDRTAELARELGAITHERDDPSNPGKGQAIAWLLPQITPEPDAYVFIDADSSIDDHFLETFDAYFAAGAQALQASYRVARPESAPLVTLRAFAFGLMHELRGRAKDRLGISVGIWGNGFAISRDALARVGWRSFSGTEDAEQHIRLVLARIPVAFAQEATVFGHMPASLNQARSQQRRWESGRLSLLRRYWLKLLRAALARNASAGVALIDLALPPLSLIAAFDCALFFLAALLGTREQLAVAISVFIGAGLYICVGFYFARLPARAYLALTHAPGYVLWKLWLYAQQLPRRNEPTWVRTSRDR